MDAHARDKILWKLRCLDFDDFGIVYEVANERCRFIHKTLREQLQDKSKKNMT